MKIILAILIVLSLSSCSLFNTEVIKVSTVHVERVPLILPEVDLYQARDLEWIIVTPDNYQEVIKDLKRKGSPALFALKSKDYQNAALNKSDTLKLVQQLQEIINAYKTYYAIDLAPAEIPTEDEIPEIE